MSTKTNSQAEKSDNKLLITVVILVVLLFFVLPIVAVGLIMFGTFSFIDRHAGEIVDAAKDGISYIDDKHDALMDDTDRWSAIYAMAMTADLPVDEGSHPIISTSTCEKVDKIADGVADDYTEVCDASEISAKVEKDDDGHYKTLTFGNDLICTRLALDPVEQRVVSAIQYTSTDGASCGDVRMTMKPSNDAKSEDDSRVEVDLPGVHVDVE